MKETNRFDNIKISENPNRESFEKPVEKKIDRRFFIKAGIAIGSLYGIGSFMKGSLENFVAEKKLADQEGLSDEEIKARLKKIAEKKPTEEQIKIEEDDRDAIGDTIRQQLEKGGEINLDMSTKKALYVKWERSYKKRPEGWPVADKWTGGNHLGLLQAMEGMQPWVESMKEEFRKIGVPEKFAYLAIPESHFDLKANSRAKAVGPYQFTPPTARNLGLSVGNGIDERRDPIESARACAEHLKYSYEKFNNDWDLAFADYNGGFTNQYAKFRTNKQDRNYQDYLAWREGRINEYLSKDSFEHKIKEGDENLTEIASYYGLSAKELMSANGMEDDKIIIGQSLKIPAATSVKLFKLRDSLENLNYPEKFYAVLDVIEEEELAKRFPPLPLNFELKKVPKIPVSEFLHTVKKGEGLFGIAREIKAMFKKKGSRIELSASQIQGMIQDQNGIKEPRKIRIGQKLRVELPLESGMSLTRIASLNKISVNKLVSLNPAVIDKDAELPIETEIRIPR